MIGLFSFIGGIIGGNAQKSAAKKASQLQYDAAIKGIDETARQFDATRADFKPYQDLGAAAAPHLGDLTGVNGNEQQQSEIDALRNSPLYKSLYRNGEEATLQNASATGGLRGGNAEAGLYHLGEDTLSNVIQQQLSNYGGLVGIGSGASGAVGQFGAQAVGNENDLRNQGAGAKAQYQLVRGGINGRNWQNAGNFVDDTIKSFLPGGGGFSFKSLFK
jgi:hypothetical protein